MIILQQKISQIKKIQKDSRSTQVKGIFVFQQIFIPIFIRKEEREKNFHCLYTYA